MDVLRVKREVYVVPEAVTINVRSLSITLDLIVMDYWKFSEIIYHCQCLLVYDSRFLIKAKTLSIVNIWRIC